MDISGYVVSKIDEAVKQGWLKVHYQPVIRSLTESLCSMESLVRWSDPEVGFLMPGLFIEALEQHRLIHKLDCYVVEHVCADLHRRMDAGLPVVPVSVNFSRLDFAMCDMLTVVEQAVERHGIPRDYLHIEITESMIVSDEELMRKVIDGFRNAGYEVWMDDFGSGYSSLTMLKDYPFDLLKLDMNFLSSFTSRSRDLIRSVISMAKDLGVKTLAEGVEVREELDFLKEMGCGKIQGNYFGRPEPMEDVFRHLDEKGLHVENRDEWTYYEAACIHVRPTDVPLEIIEDDGENFRTLYMNKAYLAQIFDDHPDLAEADRRIYQTPSPLLVKYRRFAKLLEKTRKEEVFYYTAKGNFLRFTAQVLAEYRGHYLIKGSLINMSIDEQLQTSETMDARLRELNHLFDVVHLLNLADDRITPLIGRYKYSFNNITRGMSMRRRLELFANKRVYPPERDAFLALVHFDTLRQRIESGRRGYISGVFRIMQEDGSYEREEIMIMMMPGSRGNEYLFCMKFCQVAEEIPYVTGAGRSSEAEYLSIWNSLLWNSGVKLYWKDKEQRYRGASQAFLDYFGLRSPNELIGKTDDDLELFIPDDAHRSAAYDILNRGRRISHVMRRCLVNGEACGTVVSAAPIYGHEKIIGLIGFLNDADLLFQPESGAASGEAAVDPDTGLLNAYGLAGALIDYGAQYDRSGRDYGVIVLKNTRRDELTESYGADYPKVLARELSEVILRIAGGAQVLAHPQEELFALLFCTDDRSGLQHLADSLCDALNSIRDIDGLPTTVAFQAAVVLRSDAGSTGENLYARALELLSCS